MEEIKCKPVKGGVMEVFLIEDGDIKEIGDGKLILKRKYGKLKRIVRYIDFREPEVIGLA